MFVSTFTKSNMTIDAFRFSLFFNIKSILFSSFFFFFFFHQHHKYAKEEEEEKKKNTSIVTVILNGEKNRK